MLLVYAIFLILILNTILIFRLRSLKTSIDIVNSNLNNLENILKETDNHVDKLIYYSVDKVKEE